MQGQVLGRTWGSEPALAIAAGGAVLEMRLHGGVDLAVAEPRTCTGSWRGAAHVACPEARPVGPEGVCLACSGMTEQEAACVFEPRCARDGTPCTCAATFEGVPHVVYLAFYGTLPKVGLTQAWRLARRLEEQGADAGMVVARCASRGDARNQERRLSFLHRVPEHRTRRELVGQMARAVDRQAIEVRATEWSARLEGRFAPEPLLHVPHPLPQPVPRRAYPAQAVGTHRGEWLGAKGPHVVYLESPAARHLVPEPPVAAVHMRDLVGRHVKWS